MFAELADQKNFVALKESSGAIRRTTDLHNTIGGRYAIFTGVDDLALEASILGIDGWVAGTGIAFPAENQYFWELTRRGEWARARGIYRWFTPLLHLDTNMKLVQYSKLAVQECGLGSERVRAPRLTLRGQTVLHPDRGLHPRLFKFFSFETVGAASKVYIWPHTLRPPPATTVSTLNHRFVIKSPVRRELLKDISRLVVKLGTGVLTDSRKQPDPAQLEQLVAQIADQRKAGREVVIVSSGAVGAGMGVLGYEKRPGELAELQACAAVGQPRLMAVYEKLFAAHGLHVAQVLLTHDDLEHHERHLNARNTLVTLLGRGVVPIINENDAVSFTEIKFGDNDKLSALVASLLPADLLVILTTVDGVIENFGKANPRTISIIETIDNAIEQMAGGTDSATAVGGMASKIQAAKIVVRSGIPLVIASGKKKQMLARVLAGKDEGTLFIAQPTRLQGRKRWIAFFHHPKGALFVDDGAKKALREAGKSLLPPGVARCEGEFVAGDLVRICDLNGTEFARGIAKFGVEEIRTRKLTRVELVHRDDMVIL